MYCSFKPFPCLPSKDHSQPPLYEGDGLSLLHTDCLLWPVPSAGPKGQPKGSASFPSIKKCLQIWTTPLFFFSGHICYVWDIIVVLCCIKCGDSCLKSPQSCKRRFFRDCLLEQLSKPLRPPTALCHCGFPCYITESVWPFVCPTSKHRVSSVEISALFSYSQVESVETTKKHKNIFIVPKILLFPDLLFVHCVTFREQKNVEQWCDSVGCVLSFWTSVFILLCSVGIEN